MRVDGSIMNNHTLKIVDISPISKPLDHKWILKKNKKLMKLLTNIKVDLLLNDLDNKNVWIIFTRIYLCQE